MTREEEDQEREREDNNNNNNKSALAQAFENSVHHRVTTDDLVNKAIINSMLARSSDIGDDSIIRKWGNNVNRRRSL